MSGWELVGTIASFSGMLVLGVYIFKEITSKTKDMRK